MEMQYTLGTPDGVLESKSNREAGHLFSLTLSPVEVHHCTRNGDVPVATFDHFSTISVNGHEEDDTRPKCNKYKSEAPKLSNGIATCQTSQQMVRFIGCKLGTTGHLHVKHCLECIQ